MTKLKRIACIVIIADVLAVGVLCWECRSPAGTVVSQTSSTVYDVFMEYSSPYGVLSDDVITIKYRKRASLFKSTSTIAELAEITGGGSLIMVSDSVMFVSLTCLPTYVCYTQFLANLGCHFEKCVMNEYNIPRAKDTLYSFAKDSTKVSLALTDRQHLFELSSEVGDPADLRTKVYILGAREARVLGVKDNTVQLEIIWSCSDKSQRLEYSLMSGTFLTEGGRN